MLRFAYTAALVTLFSHAVLMTYNWTETKMYQGWKLYSVDGSTTYARDVTTCAASCVLSDGPDCLATWFRPSDFKCRHFTENMIRIYESDEEETVVITQWPRALFLRDDKTYEEAEQLCNFFGGRLMDWVEINDYFDTGVTQCECAWIKGGHRMTMRQTGVNDTCAVGVHGGCGTDETLSNAWCSINT